MVKQKWIGEYKERIEFLKALDKDILIGMLLGITAGRGNLREFKRYIGKALKRKKQ